MRKLIVMLAVIAIISTALTSCENSVINTNTPIPPDNFIMYAWDYSETHYFVDTLYRRSFTEYYRDTMTTYLISNSIIESPTQPLEVWVQCEVTNANKRFCVGKVMLGERPPQGYDSSVTNPENITGEKFAGYFRKLVPSEFYHNNLAGFIGLNISVPENYHVGVVYRNYSNQMYGKGYMESLPADTIILKLVKVDNQSPDLTPLAWKLKMKNVYKIPFTNLQTSTTIKTKFNENNVYRDTITGYTTPLITMLKLDKVNNTTLLPPPDGKFDWLTGKTIFPAEGYLVFPTLEPFGRDLPLSPNDSNYCFFEIYSQKKINAQISTKAIYYAIKGNAVY
ncbi:MAG: hypothetical protein WC139_08520 [Candidatus Kapaibacterium sp.]